VSEIIAVTPIVNHAENYLTFASDSGILKIEKHLHHTFCVWVDFLGYNP